MALQQRSSTIARLFVMPVGSMLVIAVLALLTGATGPGVVPVHAAPAPQYAPGDWPQLARDPQRTNYSPQQVNPPYCYVWKWY
ncbi:MAG: hypothetical protein RML36_16835, partial [Anaerolineae bacterium]|nr:hypothetical protein [Anaerolineae bacterium]